MYAADQAEAWRKGQEWVANYARMTPDQPIDPANYSVRQGAEPVTEGRKPFRDLKSWTDHAKSQGLKVSEPSNHIDWTHDATDKQGNVRGRFVRTRVPQNSRGFIHQQDVSESISVLEQRLRRELAEGQETYLTPNMKAVPNTDPNTPEDHDYYYKDQQIKPGDPFHSKIKDLHLRQTDPTYDAVRDAFDNPIKPGPAVPEQPPQGDTIIPSRPVPPEKIKGPDGKPLKLKDIIQLDPPLSEGNGPGKPVVDAILKVIPVAQEIWFHGSRATGSHSKNSDTDILVIVPDDLVGDQYLGVVRILQKLSSHFDNYDIQPTKVGTNIHQIAQEEGQLLWSNRQDVAEGSNNESPDHLVSEFLKSISPKELRYYTIRDNCGPAALHMKDWAEGKGIDLTRHEGYFVADTVVYDKADFTKEMKREFIEQGLDFNDPTARKQFIESNPKYSEEWKKIPHYWLQDKQGNIYDPTGYIQFVKTGLSSDLDKSRYKPIRQGVAENFADGRNPQDKGDAKRHGINTKASVSSLRKTAKSGGRKGQLAHWLANMKAGRAKKKTNETVIGNLHFPQLTIAVDDHSIDRTRTRGIDPHTIDQSLRKLNAVANQLAQIEPNAQVWAYDAENNLGLGLRRISSRDMLFKLKTVVAARPFDGAIPIIELS